MGKSKDLRREEMNESAKDVKVKKDRKRSECGAGIENNCKSLVDKYQHKQVQAQAREQGYLSSYFRALAGLGLVCLACIGYYILPLRLASGPCNK